MKSEFKICTVVQGKSLETFVKNLKKAQTTAKMVELRADSINHFDIDDLEIIKGLTKLPSIFTFRHESEGGLFTGASSKQTKILKRAFELGFTYIDIAMGNPIVKELSAKEKKQLLLSWHDNKKTPPYKELENMLYRMRLLKPAIIKMATFVNNWDDILVLGSILKERISDEKLIVIGMGKKGEITRLMFPPIGSYIAYVSMKGEKNIAPGMLTEGDFKPIVKFLKHKK